MKFLLITTTIFLSFSGFSQDFDMMGTWKGYKAVPYNTKKEVIADTSAFVSTLLMNTDSTFSLLTPGTPAVMGYFTSRGTSIVFYRLVGFEEYQRFWDLRWQPNTDDPYPNTPDVIDINMPARATVRHIKKNKEYSADVFGLFRKD